MPVLNANDYLIDYIWPEMLLGVKLCVTSDIVPGEFQSIKLMSWLELCQFQ